MADEDNYIDDQEPTVELEGDDYGIAIMNWKIHEYPFYERDKRWYILFAAFVVVLLFVALAPISVWPTVLTQAPILRNFFFASSDYTFAILIVLIAVVVIANGKLRPLEVDFIITTEGFIIGQTFYDFETFKEFSIIFKPGENLKILYLEYKTSFMPRLSIQLNEADPVRVREVLLDYLDEDLVRTDESNSDYFSRIFKV